MNFGSVCSARLEGGLYSRLIGYLNISPPLHFRLDVVYKMGGVLTGHYGICTYLSYYNCVWAGTNAAPYHHRVARGCTSSI